jgi:hypothetical protein
MEASFDNKQQEPMKPMTDLFSVASAALGF